MRTPAAIAIALTSFASCASVPSSTPETFRGAVEPAAEAPAPVSSELSLEPGWVERAPVPSGSAEEDEGPGTWEKFSLTAGGMLTAMDSKVRYGPSGVGVGVDLEDLLGFDTTLSSFGVEGTWRFTENRRHQLGLAWSDLTRKSTKTLTQDLDLGNGVVLPTGSVVTSEFGVNIFRTQYNYSFFQDDRMDMAVAAGLYITPLHFELSATGLQTYSESLDITAPLPLTGLRLDFAITPKVHLRSHIDLFFLAVGGYKGSMLDTAVGFEWRAWEHFAMGLGFDAFDLDVSGEGSSSVPGVGSTGRVAFSYFGLRLYLRGLW